MRILFDFMSLQGSINGGAEYTRRVLDEVLQKKYESYFEIYALYNSKESFINHEDNAYKNDINKWVDINQYTTISDVIKYNSINTFFIGIFQRYMKYNLSGINCKSIVVIHDIASVEIQNSKLYLLKPESITERLKTKTKSFISLIFKRYREFDNDFESHSYFLLNPNTNIVTVSHFSHNSIKYNVPYLKDKSINVFYSPLRKTASPVAEPQVQTLIEEGYKYFLILSAGRWLKNADMALEVIGRFVIEHPDYYVVTTGLKDSRFQNHIALSYVDDNKLSYILKNAVALIYPTLMEGFGYPPLECMQYGVPVFSSGMASLPEVLGDAAIEFSPFYKCELYDKLNLFLNMNMDMLRKRALKQYEIVKSKQESDLEALIKLIIQ